MNKPFISYEKALNKAMYLCGKSEKCVSDIKQKLYDWKSNPEHHEKILLELQKQRFIDEKRYALYFVKDKFRFNKWGRIKIRMHLYRKQIHENLIEEALLQISEDDYVEMLKNVIKTKKKQLKEIDPYKLKDKLLRHASSKGFEPTYVIRMLEDLKI